ncbi:hypothetical protein SAMN05892877_12712 [Rhizobium subbaraonis]|uniref:Uncharacterized protein n=1 Tax=Rhizobium subbaraonis TaxID=908946 RepID=A0A285V280_9HYPH|nr:hypothetical protein [Rhizobium subbaraonis]SOC47106.1 hypothetical protein SAMN05892877_12712 [Rhizobium subbaraonis]
MTFSAAVRAQHAGRVVRRGRLVLFDFASGPIGVWNGFGRLETNDGRTWLGFGELGQVSGIAQAINGKAPELRFTVSGVDESFAGKVKGEASEYFDRLVTVFSQYFDEDAQCLDNPYAVTWGKIRGMEATRAADDNGGFVRTVSISAEGPFSNKRRAPFGYVTDRDQQNRYPGDNGMRRVAGIDAKEYKWL